jgi:hypothetical protein
MTADSESDWPLEIEIEEEQPDRVRYRLPMRDFGRLRGYAWIVALTLVALCILTIAPQLPFLRQGQPWHLFGFVFALFVALVFAVPAYYLLLYLLSDCKIEIREGELFATERAGLFRRRRRWQLARLKRLQVMGLFGPSNGTTSLRGQAEAIVAQYQTSRSRRRLGTEARAGESDPSEAADRSPFAKNLNVLTGVLDDNRRFILAAGYPRDWLTHLANDISARTNAAVDVPNRGKLETAPPVLGLQSIVAQAGEDARLAAEPDVFEQPAGSDVQVDSYDGGVTLRVPPAGMKGSAGLIRFAIIWFVMIGGFTALFAVAGVHQAGIGAGLFGAGVVMSLFWLAGAGMVLAGWNLVRRESALAVVDGKLLVMQTGLRRSKRREWPLSEIKSVRVGPSGIEVNDVPIPELQIYGDKTKLFGMLAGRDERELTWMATILRQAIGPSPHPEVPPDSDEPASRPT